MKLSNLAETEMHLNCLQEAPGINLGGEVYPEVSCGHSQPLQANAGIVLLIRT
jgi:hypothetical protein